MRWTALLLAGCMLAGTAAASAAERPVYAVVVSRHGVRSLTKTPSAYAWASWSPVAPGDLTKHGYRLMTALGAFYRSYFASEGLRVGCSSAQTFVYADREQRPYLSAEAIVEGACARAAIDVVHASATTPDPIFDASDVLVPDGRFDARASLAAVAAAVPSPPSSVTATYASDFEALQSILDHRCAGSCPRVTNGASAIRSTEGLAALTGPVNDASKYAESLFLEYAECRPVSAFGYADDTRFAANLEQAMRLHVLAYDYNARNAYNPLVRGGNLFAHIVALMQQHAMEKPIVGGPDTRAQQVAFIVGHDTQLGALGGILDAHWTPGHGIADDDMPPGSALVFELLRDDRNAYRVRVRFVTQTLAQMRAREPEPAATASVPVRFAGCTGDACTAPLASFVDGAADLVKRGFVLPAWTADTTQPLSYPPLADPEWSTCTP